MSYKVAYKKEQVIAFVRERYPQVDWSEVAQQLPPVIFRSRWDRYADLFGLPYTRRYISNLDSMGEGPANVKV